MTLSLIKGSLPSLPPSLVDYSQKALRAFRSAPTIAKVAGVIFLALAYVTYRLIFARSVNLFSQVGISSKNSTRNPSGLDDVIIKDNIIALLDGSGDRSVVDRLKKIFESFAPTELKKFSLLGPDKIKQKLNDLFSDLQRRCYTKSESNSGSTALVCLKSDKKLYFANNGYSTAMIFSKTGAVLGAIPKIKREGENIDSGFSSKFPQKEINWNPIIEEISYKPGSLLVLLSDGVFQQFNGKEYALAVPSELIQTEISLHRDFSKEGLENLAEKIIGLNLFADKSHDDMTCVITVL